MLKEKGVLKKVFKGVQQYTERSGIQGVDEGCIRLQDRLLICLLVFLRTCFVACLSVYTCYLARLFACSHAC